MNLKETKAHQKGRKFRLELSIMSIFFWGLGLFFLMAWIFFLGILAGQGLLPGGMETLAELKTQIAKLQEIVSKKDSEELDRIKGLQNEPEFAFYDELSVNKEDTSRENRIYAESRPKKKSKSKGTDPAPTGGGYVVQLASLDSASKAAGMVDRLKRKDYPVYSIKARVKGKTYYRVRCGLFKTEREALEIQGRLAKNEGIKAFVTKVNRN